MHKKLRIAQIIAGFALWTASTILIINSYYNQAIISALFSVMVFSMGPAKQEEAIEEKPDDLGINFAYVKEVAREAYAMLTDKDYWKILWDCLKSRKSRGFAK